MNIVADVLMWCPECGVLLEVHQDTAVIFCPHCGYEESREDLH